MKDKNYEEVSKKFSIDEQSGDIFLLKVWRLKGCAIDVVRTLTVCLLQPLDRDPPLGQSKWEFDILASDGELEASTRVVVNVKDVNDNSPYFPQPQSTAYVTENRPEGKVVNASS